MLSGLMLLKEKLQFTGWLQYLPVAILALLLFLLAAIFWTSGLSGTAYGFMGVGFLLLGMDLFDVVTVKFDVRPRERIPERNEELDAFELMRSRVSCRSFQWQKMTSSDRDELLEFVRHHTESPEKSLMGDGPIRFEYISARLTVWPVVGAHEFLVAIAPKEYQRLSVIDVGRTLQKIVVDATRIGLSTCWIGPGADQEDVMRQLGDRFDVGQDHVICVCAVGYQSWYKPLLLRFIQRLQRRRLPLSALCFADSDMKTPLDVEAGPFERFKKVFEVCQWSPSAFNGQPARCVALASSSEGNSVPPVKENGVARVDFYTAKASQYYSPVAVGIWCASWEMGCEALGIEGRFAVLPPQTRGSRDGAPEPELPRYEVSWVPGGNA